MVGGIALFLAGAILFQTYPGLPAFVYPALCVAGMAVYARGWWLAFRAKINSDWFSKALNILGAVFFFVLGVMMLIRMLAA